jgi:hypothetical protein
MTGYPVASVRSLLAVGACATSVVAATVIPSPTAVTSAMTVSPSVALRAAVTPLLEPVNVAAAAEYAPTVCCSNPSVDPQAVPLTSAGSVIINTFDALEPWVAYGFELADYALSFVPGLWWIAPAIDLAYFSIEPLVQAGVYSFAYLIDGQFADIGPTLALGVQEAVDNFIFFGIAWIGSLIPLPPLPPLPPIPPFPAAGVSAPAQSVSRTAAVAGAAATAEAEIVAPEEAVATSVTAPRSAKASSVRSAARAASAVTPADAPEVPAASAAQAGAESAEPTAAVQTTADRTNRDQSSKLPQAGNPRSGRPAAQ